MEALRANYGSESDTDSEDSPHVSENASLAPMPILNHKEPIGLPPPPVDLLHPTESLDCTTYQGNRIRSFPHIQGNYAVHIFIPGCTTYQGNHIRSLPHVQGNYALHIFIPVRIPPMARKHLASSLRKVSSIALDLYDVDMDVELNVLCKDSKKFEQLILGREFHISLGRPVPIKFHQIDSIVAMLRQRLQHQRRYWMEFNEWDVFVNDELTRSFLSLEITGQGLLEIAKQISIVDQIYRLHGLPEFYKNPRPHVSLAWALGDVSNLLKPVAEQLNKFKNSAGLSGGPIFTCNFSGVECKIGKKFYTVCKFPD